MMVVMANQLMTPIYSFFDAEVDLNLLQTYGYSLLITTNSSCLNAIKSILFDNPLFRFIRHRKTISIMIVSPDPIPKNRDGNGTDILSVGKILEIQQEILLINRHKREHVANDSEIRQLDSSCAYCQRYRQRRNEPQTDSRQMTIGRQQEVKNKKSVGTLNEIERMVDASGRNGCVIVPRTWLGKRVRIVLVED